MPGKDTKLAFSKTMKQGRKRTRVTQQASSGAPEPALEPALDPRADVQREPSSSSTAKQGGKIIQFSQQSSSGAPEPAAIGSAVQFHNDDDKKLGGLRKRRAEDACGAPKIAASSGFVEEVHQVERSPTRAQATSPGEEEDARGASQPVASSGLVEDVQEVGRSPTRAQATSPGEEEDARAESLRRRLDFEVNSVGVEIDPSYIRMLEERAARNSRRRRKAIDDLYKFCVP